MCFIRLLLSLSLPLFAFVVSCRSPENAEPQTPLQTDFDASVPDGGELAPIAACAADGRYTFNNNFSPYFGGASEPLVEVNHFSSFYCPHCADFAAYTHARWQNRAEYENSVRIYFHHANLGYRHFAAAAAANQGMEYFWALHDFIYAEMLANSGPSDAEIDSYVENTLKLDMVRFEEDTHSKKTLDFLSWDINQGLDAGMVGTPTVFVCGDPMDNWTYLEDYIDAEL